MLEPVYYLFIGLVAGLIIVAPIGPIAILCIRRTLSSGRIAGIVSGLGAATADFFYGAVAAFGLAFISSFLLGEMAWLRIIGGLFLIYLGVRTFLSKPADKPAQAKYSLTGAYVSTFLLTITNPMTILSFAAAFSGIGSLMENASLATAGFFSLGIFLGSVVWWLILCSAVDLFRGKLTPPAMAWVNRISGAIIALFGVVALAGLL